jgi:subtilisin family serine protease
MSFVPNDPFYFPGSNPAVGGPGSTSSTSFPGQWHLLNQMPATTNNNPSIHVNVVPAWLNNFTGAGIITGVVDDAVQINHPDLFENTNPVASLHRSYSSTGSVLVNDSTPTATAENHGTSVAGLIAARGGNGIGTTGSAPFANLVGMRTGNLNSNALVAAINHANGIGPGQIHIKNHSYGFVSAFLPNTSQLNTPIANSAAAGTVNVYAAGNNRNAGAEDANKIQPQNQPHVIVVAALGSDGRFSNYSNYGANVFVTAPSNVTAGSRFTRLISTDRTGSAGYNTSGSGDFASTAGGGTGLDYTNNFGGTSSSAPIVAGVLALALEANPNLRTNSGGRNTTRALKHLLVRTSTVVDAADASQTSDGGWRTNAAGYRFNPNYGFGLINANALVVAAPQFVGVTPLTTASSGTIAVTGGALLDNNPVGISRSYTFNIPANQLQPLEEVVVTLSVTHTYTGDLQGVLTSPSGTSLRFMNRSAADGQANLTNWQFTVNGFWGENPNGTWTINVADVLSGDLGTWNSFAIEVRMGDLVPVPEPAWLLVVAVTGFLAWRRFAGGI